MLSALFFCVEAFAAKEYKLLSPNGKLEITITAEPQLAYSVKCDGEQILATSQIGLKIYEGANLGEKPVVKKVKRTWQAYENMQEAYNDSLYALILSDSTIAVSHN